MGNERAFERPPVSAVQYELLRELSPGPLGSLNLARVVGGRDAGRSVLLRNVRAPDPRVLIGPVERAVSIAHPRLIKVLGATWVEDSLYIVSEHVDGLPMGELTRALREAETSAVPEVALRLALDLLLAASAARVEVGRFGKPIERCLYPDTAWVAGFGETLLSDAGLAYDLFNAADGAGEASLPLCTPEETVGLPPDERSDVFAAGGMLWELLTGLSLPADAIPRLDQVPGRLLETPAALVDLVARATAPDPTQRFQRLEEMARAIRNLPGNWIATDAEVQVTLEALRHSSSVQPASVGDQPSGEHAIDPWESPTRSLRGRVQSRSDDTITVRPPGASTPRPNR